RTQTIRLEVIDVDESPKFLNSPKPFIAVVPYEKPLGYKIYQFVARDEYGEGNNDIEYRLINSEPPGAFVVDPKSGIVRTAQRQYSPGSIYKIYVQARDSTPLENSTIHKSEVIQRSETIQQSEVAVLEVYAGDRAPQFMQPRYHRRIREDSDVGNSLLLIETHSFRPIDDRRQKGPKEYYLYVDQTDDESPFFEIDRNSGLVTLKRALDYDDPALPKIFNLR
ncbi:hypothetical protein FO519_010312, partial [Halicephalobus sp. NKZ332]